MESQFIRDNESLIQRHHLVALLSLAKPHIATGARSAQGEDNRLLPLPPRALANKIAAARYLQLIPFGYRVGREVTSL